MNHALIIQIGANLKENKGLSPIFKDNTYEYIPSPLESTFNLNKHHNHRHYSKLICQNQNLTDMHMSSFVNEGTAHLDPEFYTYTYGETRNPYITQLEKLKYGDILLFSMWLQKYDTKKNNFILNGSPNLYIVGFFMINNIHEFNGPLNDTNSEGFTKNCNEHFIYRTHHIHTPENKKLLLVQGDKQQSQLFKHPLKISLEEVFLKKYIKNWGMKEISKTLNSQWCLNEINVKKELFEHGKLNRWIEWFIP